MRVSDLMQTDLRTVRGEATVADAVSLMAQYHISGLPVIDAHGHLVGVLTSSDILQAQAESDSPEERQRLFEETLVREIMTPRPQTIALEATLKEAAQRLLYLEIHRLFVEGEGKLVGVISTSDIVRALATARSEK